MASGNRLNLSINLMKQNVVYASPSIQSTIMCDQAGATFDKATKADFVLNSQINITNGQAPLPGNCFVRCTSGDVTVSLSRA